VVNRDKHKAGIYQTDQHVTLKFLMQIPEMVEEIFLFV
jgi:hypothetical protein